MRNDRIVWDSHHRGPPPRQPARRSGPPRGDGIVRIKRETSGRGGKTVTTIHGVPLGDEALEALVKELKKRCGVGGSLKERVIELQGDQRDVVEALLVERGFRVKRAGG